MSHFLPGKTETWSSDEHAWIWCWRHSLHTGLWRSLWFLQYRHVNCSVSWDLTQCHVKSALHASIGFSGSRLCSYWVCELWESETYRVWGVVLLCSFPKTFILSEEWRIGGLGILNTAFSLSSICFKRELWVEIFILLSSNLFFLFFLTKKVVKYTWVEVVWGFFLYIFLVYMVLTIIFDYLFWHDRDFL